MNRFSDIHGKYDSAPICAHGDGHECNSVEYCNACEGKVYCDDHLKQCDGCKKLWCEKHAKLTRTNCGWLCEECIPEYGAREIPEREPKVAA